MQMCVSSIAVDIISPARWVEVLQVTLCWNAWNATYCKLNLLSTQLVKASPGVGPIGLGVVSQLASHEIPMV